MKKTNRWKVVVGAGLMVMLAGGGVVAVWQARSGASPSDEATAADGAQKAVARDRAARTKGVQGQPKKRTRKIADPRDDMSVADRRLYDAVQDALDAEDFARTRAAALRAYQSANPDVRLQAVEALGWFGEKALVDLVPMMGDANEDVAQEAANAWEGGLAEVEDTKLKLAFAQAALKAITNADTLTMVGAEFSTAATDLIDAADGEAASRLRVQTIQTLVDLMDQPGGGKRAEVSKELYEEITGHSWISLDEAERYLRDPENYEPPEDPAE